MKKLKKFFGVFAVALLLMSMSSNKNIDVVEKNTCADYASISANNFCCDVFGEDYGSFTYYIVYSATLNAMGC